MAVGIDVFFTGLMLICLDGQATCAKGGYEKNIAWVVKADGESEPCGWPSPEKTDLMLQFSSDDFELKQGTCIDDKGTQECSLSSEKDICVKPDPKPEPADQSIDASSLQRLPRLDEVDRRFKAVREDRLKDEYYVPFRIHFPTGVIGAGELWPPKGNSPLWYRSDDNSGGALPRKLSDRLKVRYEKTNYLFLTDCRGKVLIELSPKADRTDYRVLLLNRADATLNANEFGRFADLTYLFWYYRLGSWNAPYGVCPDYTGSKAVLLRCIREDHRCWCYDNRCQAETKFWPPMLGSGSY